MPNTIWDRENVSYYTIDNHRFVFLWVCNNGNVAGNSTPILGMPYCWTKQGDLSPDGYGNPDSRQYCFIGFENASVTLMEGMGTYNGTTENTYKYWLTFFYYYVLNGNTINQSLDLASRAVGYADGWTDGNNRLSQGYNYTWYGGGGQPPGTSWGKMRIYGNGSIYLPQES